MWIHTDQAAGQDFGRRELRTIISLACAVAFVIGIAIDFSILSTLAGEGGIIIMLDVLAVPFWTVTLLVAGTVFGNVALRTGWFGLITWTLGSILAVATVAILVYLLPQVGELRNIEIDGVAELLFWPVHLGVLFGGLSGLLVWERVVRTRPDLLSDAENQAATLRKTGVAVGISFIACWIAVVATIVWAWFA